MASSDEPHKTRNTFSLHEEKLKSRPTVQHCTLHAFTMDTIQKANAFPTWWTAASPKYGINVRVQLRAGLTDDECRAAMKARLKRVDRAEDERRVHEAYLASDEYALIRLKEFKRADLDSLARSVTQKKNNASSIYAGGYTGPAIMSHKSEIDQIQAFEERTKAEIEKKYDGSPESLAIVRAQIKAEEAAKGRWNRSHRL